MEIKQLLNVKFIPTLFTVDLFLVIVLSSAKFMPKNVENAFSIKLFRNKVYLSNFYICYF